MEASYLVSATTNEVFAYISSVWQDITGPVYDLAFESVDRNVFDVMAKVIKLEREVPPSITDLSFSISGKCLSDWDCVVFSIEYADGEPKIKSAQADPELNEGRFYSFADADYKEIPSLLKKNKSRTFKQAIKDDIPLGGFLDMSYDAWVKSITK